MQILSPIETWVKLLCWRLLHLVLGFVVSCNHTLYRIRLICSPLSSSKLKKLPKHLALLIDSEDVLPHLCKVVQLLEQLANLGFHHVTLYDMKGVLKSYLPNALQGNQIVKYYTHDENIWKDAEAKSQFKQKRQLIAEVLCIKDGKQAIVKAARSLCLKALQSGDLSALKEEDIDSNLTATGGMGPDPDLLLLFSNSRCASGFPPWRLRLTEFHHIGSIKNLTKKSLLLALEEFSHKQQRYGK